MKKTLTFLFALSCGFSFSQTQLTHLESPGNLPSNPRQFFTFNSALYFVASDGRTGSELWRSDGTVLNTSLVKDINLGIGSSVISNFVELKNKLYFVADDGVHGYQLWATDGTSAGTTWITENMNSPVQQLRVSGDFIYFLKKIGSNVLEVWKSDGTKSGTSLVKGNIPVWNTPENLTSALGLVFFSAQPEGSNNSRVWRTDGTTAGTFPVTNALDGSGSAPGGTSHPTQFIEYNGALYFVARSAQMFSIYQSVGIVKTDGTIAGTQPVEAVHDGNTNLLEYGDVMVYQGKIYFSFFDADKNHYFIWESTGLASGTNKIYEHVATAYFAPSSLCGSANNLFFTSGNPSGGTSLTRYDLTTGTPQVLKELAGTLEQPFIFFRDYDLNSITAGKPNDIFIESTTTHYGNSNLWTSNGTAAGTVMLSDVERMGPMTMFNNRLYFSGLSEVDFELWSSDGTLSGTSMLKDINLSRIGMRFDGSYSLSRVLHKAGNQAVFGGFTAEHGYELWVTNGTEQGTKMLADLSPGKSSSFPYEFISTNDKAFFIVSPVAGKSEIYSTNGTATGTSAVTDLFSSGAKVSKLVKLSENKFIVVGIKKTDQTSSLYKLDLTQGVTEITTLGNNIYGVPLSLKYPVTLNGTLYFIVDGGGDQLWKSDGTTQGTVKIKDLVDVSEMTGAGNLLYIASRETYDGPQQTLYRSDGTPGGTVLFKTIFNPPNSGGLNLFPFGSKLVFTPTDAASGKEVWITDGTEANTAILKDINPGSASGIGHPQFTVQNGVLFFTANDHKGAELWKTDGTATGTSIIKDINVGTEGSSPNNLSATGERVYFSAYTTESGFEAWSSAGTENDTKAVADVVPGPVYSNPREFLKLNDNLLFIAHSALSGEQLFSYNEGVTSTAEDFHPLVNIYPNPSSAVFNLEGEKLRGSVLTVYNSEGACVAVQSNLTENEKIDLQAFPSGLYFFRFVKDNKIFTLKVMKSQG